MKYPWFRGLKLLPLTSLVLALLFAVACGSAAEPQQEPAAQPPTAQQQQQQAPTAIPEVMEQPAAAMVKRDQLIIMTESFGNEVFDHKFRTGDKHIWEFYLDSHVIGSDHDLKLNKEGIASDWVISDAGKSFEFTLKEGIKFHNGDVLKPEDAAWFFNHIYSPGTRFQTRQRMIDKIEPPGAHVTGPNSYQISFTIPFMPLVGLFSEIGQGGYGAVVSKAYYESFGADHQARSDGYLADPSPGAAGPFERIDNRPADEILYQKVPGYYSAADRPYPFEQLSIRLVPELSTRMAALQTGDAHIVAADLEVEDQIKRANARIIYGLESTVIWINAWNCSVDAPQTSGKDLEGRLLNCSDKRVRHALDYAIDKEAIQDLLGGPGVFSIKGSAAVSPSGVGYVDDGSMDPFPYDPDKAKALFQEAGFKVPGFDAGEEPNYGEPWQVWTWPGGATVPKMIELVQLVCDDWKTVLDLNCNVNVGEEASVKDKQYGGEIPGQYLVRSNEHSYDVGSKYRGRFGDPEGSYISYDPLMEPLVTKMLSMTDPDARHEAYAAAHRQAIEGHWDFAPGYLNAPYAVTNEIAEWTPRTLRPSPSALWTIVWAK